MSFHVEEENNDKQHLESEDGRPQDVQRVARVLVPVVDVACVPVAPLASVA